VFKFLVPLFCLLAQPVLAVVKTEIKVSEKSTVRVGDPIRLGYLIPGPVANTELLDKVYDVIVFEALNSEEDKVLTSSQIAQTLRQKLSFQDLQHLALKVPEEVTIQVRRNFLYPTDIARDIRRQAQQICSGCQIQFEDLTLPEFISNEEILKTRLDLQSLRMGGSFLLPLHIETSKGKSQVWVTGKVSFYKDAPVAKRMIRSGESLSSDDFEIKNVNVTLARDGVPTLEEIKDHLAAKMITVGQAIFFSDLKKEPAALRGQMVRILVGDEGFEITSSGIAQEAGSKGDMIKVKSTDTQKVLAGVLVDKGTVRVQ
jgi:flagellar basal body P-ring formation protein FlgA